MLARPVVSLGGIPCLYRLDNHFKVIDILGEHGLLHGKVAFVVGMNVEIDGFQHSYEERVSGDARQGQMNLLITADCSIPLLWAGSKGDG